MLFFQFVAEDRDQGKWLCTVYEGSEPLPRDTNITLYGEIIIFAGFKNMFPFLFEKFYLRNFPFV